MQQQHHFFQTFFPQQGAPQADPPYMQHNLLVLNIMNNWQFARWLMCRHREGWLKQVDEMEKVWLDFLINNKIDIESYKDKEQFWMQNSKKPEN